MWRSFRRIVCAGWSHWLCALTLGVFAMTGWSQKPPHWRYWRASDGLSESYTRSVFSSASGKVWVNHGDVTEMSWLDGYDVSNLPSPGPRLPVRESRTGEIWSITTDGFLHFQNGQWITYSAPGILRETPFHPIGSSQVLLLQPDCVKILNGSTGAITPFRQANGSALGRFIHLINTPDDSVWITGENGVAQFSASSVQDGNPPVWKEFSTEKTGLFNLRNPAIDTEGRLYAIAESTERSGQQFVRFDGTSWTLLFSLADNVRRAWPGDDRGYWAQTRSSLLRLDRNGEETDPSDRLIFERINDVSVQPGQEFWLATSHGLIQHVQPAWRIPIDIRSIDKNVHAIREDSQGRIWFAGDRSLICLQNDQWTFHPLPDGIRSHPYETDALCFLPGGRLLFNGSSDPSLITYDRERDEFEFIRHPAGRKIRLIAPRHEGGAWVRTQGSARSDFRLEIYDGTTFRPIIDLKDQRPYTRIRHVFEAKNGDIWVGSLMGLGVYSDGRYEAFTAVNGYTGSGAFWIHETDEDKIWVGDRNNIYELDGKTWTTVMTGIDSIRSMITARDGSVWVASGMGVMRYWKGTLVLNSEEEGLPSPFVNRIYQDSQKRIWAGTTRGICLYNPDTDRDRPETSISSAMNLLETPPGGHVRLVFSGVDKWNYTLAEQLLFSHRLDDEAWTHFHSGTSVSFDRLSYGSHRFEVRAMDRNWNTDLTPAAFEFTVLWPWYRTTGFIIIATFGSILILFLIGLTIRHNVKLEKLVKLRTANLTLTNQSLQHEIAERLAAEESLETSEHLYRNAIEVADAVPYYRNYTPNRYDFVGDGIEALTGYSKEEFTPELWGTLVQDVVLIGEFAHLSLEDAIQKARSATGENWRADFLVNTRQGEKRWIANAAVEVKDDQSHVIGSLGILQDITERKRTENALRDSEAKNRALLDAIPDFMVRINRNGVYLDCKSSQEFDSLYVGKNVRDVLPADVARSMMDHLQTTLATGKMEIFEYGIGSNERNDHFETRIVPSGPDEVLAIVRDISERKRLEKEIVAIRETERKRIGDELHDDICQGLTGIAIKSKVLEEKLAAGPLPNTEEAAEITTHINQAISKTRILAKGLHPIDLETHGLMDALEELTVNTEKMYNIPCRIDCPDRVFITDNTIAIHLYRIAQEALNNAARHSQATQVWVRLENVDHQVTLTVKDNGIGIPETIDQHTSMGLRIMKYRARRVGASFEIQREASGGTTITCSLPESNEWKGIEYA